ncbi:hypothetical protein [Streptomyces sp. NPDC051219]|uniref:hypothetical protein n=1 Tax=Streptomyces sp. NPDC051219 TaxID=3155283 RepID=UPI003443C5E7
MTYGSCGRGRSHPGRAGQISRRLDKLDKRLDKLATKKELAAAVRAAADEPEGRN